MNIKQEKQLNSSKSAKLVNLSTQKFSRNNSMKRISNALSVKSSPIIHLPVTFGISVIFQEQCF